MNPADWIDGHAARTPGATAIRHAAGEASYAVLAETVERLAAALSACGVGRGACVALLALNKPHTLALFFACARLGALFMPLNWRLAAPEHRRMLEDCPPTVLLVDEPFLAQSADFAAALPGATAVALSGTPAPGWIGHAALLARAAGPAPRDPAVGPDMPLLICYTSGSTGTPKGVLLSQRAVQANAEHSVEMHGLSANDVVLTTLPLFHVGGLNNLTTPALQAGASVVLHPKFDVEATFDAIERERVTLTVLVPAQLAMMLAHPRWATADLASLRMITTGSTIVPEHLIRAVHERGVPLVQIYGSTETCPIASYLGAADAQRKAGSAGRAARQVELRIADERGHELPAGAQGEILVRGPNVMLGYWKQAQASATALAGGWFHSGDIGHFDGEGYLWVDGRKNDMIISGGENVAPAEVENLLLECSDVAEVALVGLPDERWGEVVVAVLAPRPGAALSSEGVLALLEGRIARYKQPKRIFFVNELPKTALGKVRREDVRRLAAGLATQPAAQEHMQ